MTARTSGERVEDLSERTEKTRVYANPDGTWTSEAAPEPTQVRDAKGAWHLVDTTLVAKDGVIAPRWSAADVALSAGGDQPLVSVNAAGKHLSWRWGSGTLPAPTLNGDTATYANVLPGTDLVVRATVTGFEDSLVVKRRPSGPVVFATPVETDGATLTAASNGSVAIDDQRGHRLVSAAAPVMFDASRDAGGQPHAARVPVAVDKTPAGKPKLSLTADQAFLNDPSTVYPVTIDPSFTLNPTGDTWVYNSGDTSGQVSDETLKVGTWDAGVHKARAYLHFDQGDSQWDGKDVVSAKLLLRNYNSHSCTGADVRVSRVTQDWDGAAMTWATQPTVSSTDYADFVPAHGYSATSCPYGDASFNVTSIVRLWATGTANYGFRVKGQDETDSNTWRLYRSANYSNTDTRPRLVVTWDRPPATASVPAASPVTSWAPPGGTSSLYTADSTPSISTTLSDIDGDSVHAVIRAYASKTGSPVSTCTTKSVASGGTASCSLTTALPDGLYYLKATASDGYRYTGGTTNIDDTTPKWSGWNNVQVATSTPAAPVITCTGHPGGSWDTNPPATDVPCTISAAGSGSGAPGRITYTADGTINTVTIPQSTDPTVASTPVTISKLAGGHKITATAVGPAGVKSATATLSFGYGPMGMAAPAAGAPVVTTGTVAVDASGPPVAAGAGTPAAHVKWRLAASGQDDLTGWNDGGSQGLTVTSDATGVHVQGTWDARTATHDAATGVDLDARVPALLDIQVCVTYAAGDQCTWAVSNPQVERVAHAFGAGFPTADVAGGQVALWTGEFATDATDASLNAGGTTLSVSRTAGSYAGPAASTASGVFGPGWTAGLDGPDAGLADYQLIDSTLTDGTLTAVDGTGEAMVFAPAGGQQRRTDANLAAVGADWVPVDDATAEAGITAHVDGTGTDITVTLTEPDGTKTVFAATTAPTASSAAAFAPGSVHEPGQAGVTTYDHDDQGRVTRILAPVPAGVTCPATGALPTGCRALSIAYATATTATATAAGDYVGRVSGISSVVGDGTQGGVVKQLAAYAYDPAGRLVSVANPEDGLTTAYGYDGASNRLASITPPGLTPIKYAYSGASNRLATVTRDRPAGDPTGGTATLATIVYNVPTRGASGLPDLTDATVGGWNQPAAPTYAAAVFGPNHVPSSTDPAAISASDWPYASLSYADNRGYELNTANYGAGAWQYTDTEYDTNGNLVRELDERDIAGIVNGDTVAADAGTLITYNTDQHDGNGNTVLPAGTVVTDTYGPARYAVLSDGSSAWIRPHTHNDYDQGAPNNGIDPGTGQAYAVPTTTTVSAYDPGSGQDLDTLSVTRTGYDNAVPGGAADAGWSMGLASTSTIDMGAGNASIVSKISYDGQGRLVATSQPESNGADAGTRQTVYYTADANSAVAGCGNKPAWADLFCQTHYAGAPTSGPDLITSTVTGYNDDQQPTEVTETSRSTTRTTKTTYRPDGLTASTAVNVTGLPGSTPVPSTTYTYAADTGLLTTVTPSTGAPIITGYDGWGRTTSYSAAAGETTTTSYDAAGQVKTVTDPQGATTYTYDGTDAVGNIEHRGLPTSESVSNPNGRAVTITGAYNAAGDLTTETFPGAMTRRAIYDTAGHLTDLSYSGHVVVDNGDGTTSDVADQEWLAWSRTYDAADRVHAEWTPDGAAYAGDTTGSAATGYARQYTYDRASRLTHVVDRTAAPATGGISDPNNDTTTAGMATNCTIRDYTFDRNGNRTGLATTPAGANGDCQTGFPTGVISRAWAYDDADRNTSSYAYDNLGRQTSVPQADTPAAAAASATPGPVILDYYDSDAVHAINQAGITTTFSLDASGRRSVAATGPTGSAPAASVTSHYDDSTDSASWEETSTATATFLERYVSGLGSDLTADIAGSGAVRVVLTNPHGDSVSEVTVPTGGNAAGIDDWSSTDEYGNSAPSAVGTTATNPSGAGSAGAGGGLGYGWLASRQRATDSSGLLLMGSRLYNPATGQFSSLDPIYGGNATAYNYPDDPMNMSDVTGLSVYPGGDGGNSTPEEIAEYARLVAAARRFAKRINKNSVVRFEYRNGERVRVRYKLTTTRPNRSVHHSKSQNQKFREPSVEVARPHYGPGGEVNYGAATKTYSEMKMDQLIELEQWWDREHGE